MSKWIRGINGQNLGIKSEIYDDLRGTGNKEFILNALRTGVYIDVLTEEEEQRLAESVGITIDELEEIRRARR